MVSACYFTIDDKETATTKPTQSEYKTAELADFSIPDSIKVTIQAVITEWKTNK